jgi:hypothetical protein
MPPRYRWRLPPGREQLEMVGRWNAEERWGLDIDPRLHLEEPAARSPGELVVLVPYLGTPADTVAALGGIVALSAYSDATWALIPT